MYCTRPKHGRGRVGDVAGAVVDRVGRGVDEHRRGRLHRRVEAEVGGRDVDLAVAVEVGRDQTAFHACEAVAHVVDPEVDICLTRGRKVNRGARRAGRCRVDANRDDALVSRVGDVDDAVAVEVEGDDAGGVAAADEGNRHAGAERDRGAFLLREVAEALADVIGGDELEQAVVVEIDRDRVANLEADLGIDAGLVHEGRKRRRGRDRKSLASILFVLIAVTGATRRKREPERKAPHQADERNLSHS